MNDLDRVRELADEILDAQVQVWELSAERNALIDRLLTRYTTRQLGKLIGLSQCRVSALANKHRRRDGG